ncbi:PASTA domain-containing protein [Rhodococcus ruber]|nr:PASTA domain-containing protein [Rhodococcus ruber]
MTRTSSSSLVVPETARRSGRSMRASIAAGCAAVLLGAGAAVLPGAGTAAARPAPNVVGMSEQHARATLEAQGVPYNVVNRAGAASGHCHVTGQRDRGYRTEVDMQYDHEKNEFERVETPIWQGVGLTVVCN